MKAKEKFFNIANTITLFRIVLLFILVFMVIFGDLQMIFLGIIMVIFIIFLDWVDGVVAKRLNIVTKAGGLLDITVDRIVENSLWILLMYIDMIPIWIPLIFITRGFLVDFSRAYTNKEGWTVIHSKLSQILVSSRIARGLYGIAKAAAFVASFSLYYIKVGLATSNFSKYMISQYEAMMPALTSFQIGLVWFVAIFCIVRGILTIYDSIKFM